LKNTIAAGCDTVEHAFGLTQEQANTIVEKKLAYDPTLQRYTEPYMDDNDNKNTGGKYRMIPIFEKAVTIAAATKGMKIMVGSGVDGSTFPHGTQALEIVALVKQAHMTPAAAIQAATVNNAEVFGMAEQVGSLQKGSSLTWSLCPAIARRHHRAHAREVRDERRQGDPQRADAEHGGLTPAVPSNKFLRRPEGGRSCLAHGRSDQSRFCS
jgi:hypothetical protein